MVTINGKSEDVSGMLLSDYLESIGCETAKIAVEINEEIVPKRRYCETQLQDGDVVEVVSFVGGG